MVFSKFNSSIPQANRLQKQHKQITIYPYMAINNSCILSKINKIISCTLEMTYQHEYWKTIRLFLCTNLFRSNMYIRKFRHRQSSKNYGWEENPLYNIKVGTKQLLMRFMALTIWSHFYFTEANFVTIWAKTKPNGLPHYM